MSWNPCPSLGDAVANDAVDDAANQPLLGCCDGGNNGSNSENGADATKPPAADGQGGDRVNAGSSSSSSLLNNNTNTNTNQSGLFDHNFNMRNSNNKIPPPPYQEMADNTFNAGAMASNDASGSGLANTAHTSASNLLVVDLIRRLVTFPCIPLSLIIIIIIIWLHIKMLPTMDWANKAPVYFAGCLFLILAASFQYKTGGTATDGTNNNGTGTNPFTSRSFARLLLAADAALLAGIHLFYLNDISFTDNYFLFIFFWVVVIEVLDVVLWIWCHHPNG